MHLQWGQLDRSSDFSRGFVKSSACGLPTLPRSWGAASVDMEKRSSGMGRVAIRLAWGPQNSCSLCSASSKDWRVRALGKFCGDSQVSLPVTLWLTPGDSQLREMLSCVSNRYSTGMCLGRPEHSCLPNRRVALPPALPLHCGKLEPICPQTRLVCRLCLQSSRPWPCPRSLAQEALWPG